MNTIFLFVKRLKMRVPFCKVYIKDELKITTKIVEAIEYSSGSIIIEMIDNRMKRGVRPTEELIDLLLLGKRKIKDPVDISQNLVGIEK